MTSIFPFSNPGNVSPMATGTICIFSNGQLIPLTAQSGSATPMAWSGVPGFANPPSGQPNSGIGSFTPMNTSSGTVTPAATGGMCFFSADSTGGLIPFCA